MNRLASLIQGQPISVGQPSAAQPPPPQEVPPDFSDVIAHKPKRGGLPIALVASIQKMFAEDAQRQAQQQQNSPPQQLGLQPGWGGQGR